MDDLSAMLSGFLSNPDNMAQLQAMLSSAGAQQQEPVPPEPSARSNMQNMRQGQNRGQYQNGYQGSYNNYNSRQNNQRNNQYRQEPAQSQPVHDVAAPLAAAMEREKSAPNIDMGALASLLGKLSGNNAPPPPQNTPDLSALLGALGGGGNAQQQNTPDLSALLGALGGGGNAQQQNTPDLSALLGALGGGGGQSQSQGEQNAGGLNLSALTSLLGGAGGSGGQKSGGLLPNMDFGTLLKIQNAISALGTSNENVKILLSLKSHLQTERAQKVDDAIRVMQLIQFLPLIKESGLLGNLGLDGFFDNFSLKNFGLDSLSKLNIFGGR